MNKNELRSVLNLTGGFAVAKGPEMTHREMKLLEEFYPVDGIRGCLAAGLDRPVGTIRHWAHIYGIKKNKKWHTKNITAFEKEIITVLYPIGGLVLCDMAGLRLRHSHKTIAAWANRQGLRSPYSRRRSNVHRIRYEMQLHLNNGGNSFSLSHGTRTIQEIRREVLSQDWNMVHSRKELEEE